jgi:hypothetical protein
MIAAASVREAIANVRKLQATPYTRPLLRTGHINPSATATRTQREWGIARSRMDDTANRQRAAYGDTPLAGPSSRARTTFASVNNQCLSFAPSSDRVRTTLVSLAGGFVRMTDRARHHRDQASARPRPCSLAAWPPKNVGVAPASKRISQNPGCLRAGANHQMAYGAGDPLSLLLVTAIR